MQESYREIFLAESEEYLNIISQCLVKLEEVPSNSDALNETFRAIHTLKGMAATMGFENLARLSHQIEDLLDALRSKQIQVTSEIIDSLFSCLDVFEALVQEIKTKKKAGIDITPYLENVQSFLNKEAKPWEPEIEASDVLEFDEQEHQMFEESKTKGLDILKIKIKLAKDCVMKQTKAFVISVSMQRKGQVLKTIPSEEGLRQGRFDTSFIVVLATREKAEVIHHDLLCISEVESIDITPVEAIKPKQVTGQPLSSSAIKKIQSMRISVGRLDKIMNLMGELAIAKIRLLQVVQSQKIKPLEDVSDVVDRLTSALQDEVLQTRLLPISYVLDTFPRIVRDLSRKQNKKIELKIIGSEIELDRTILDEIGDPLVHLIRNAIDHGIEGPQERQQAKKDPKGKIVIKVTRQRGQIEIEAADNGRGIDNEKVIQKAHQKGLITREDIPSLTDDKEAVYDLLATPGFSMSEKVTEVSGRGVGLDVVKAKIDALGGKFEVDSELGAGTRFTLTLPLTLAIIKAMLVKVNTETFALPLMSIRETIKIEQKELRWINNFEVITVRDEVIPILRLDKELEIVSLEQHSGEQKRLSDKRLSIVIVEHGKESIGLVVSKVLGELDIVVKPLGSIVKRIKGITGATILGDGRVALILDVMNLR